MRERMSDMGLLVLRVCVGLLMLTHGIPKLLNYETLALTFPDPLGVGSELSAQLVIGAEVGCAVLLMLGLFTRLAAIPLLITMLVAVLVHHATDAWDQKELPLLYAVAFLTVLLAGPGSRSLDGWFERRVRGVRNKPTGLEELYDDTELLGSEDAAGAGNITPGI